MKYIKITLLLFISSLILAFVGVKAEVGTTLSNVQVPRLNSVYTSGAKAKDTWNVQYINKTRSYNNANNNDLVEVQAKVVPQLAGAQASGWVTTVTNQNVSFGNNSSTAGSWKVQLKNVRSGITSSFFGVWLYNM